MGTTVNYREKINNRLAKPQDPQTRGNDERVLRLLDALEKAQVKNYGLCKKVAEITGYSRNRVSDMLSGKSIMSRRFVVSTCTAFRLNTEYVLSGEGSMLPPGSYGRLGRTAGGVLDEIKKLKGLHSDTALGQLFGVERSTVATWRSRDSLPYKDIIAFCLRENIELESIFADEQETVPEKVSEENQACGNCWHWYAITGDAEVGECRRFPPTIHGLPQTENPTDEQIAVRTFFPCTTVECCCGEWATGPSQMP